MKLIILFLSAICFAMMIVGAYYSAAPWPAVGLLCFAALIPVILILAYIPAWRHWSGMATIIVILLPSIPLMWVEYDSGLWRAAIMLYYAALLAGFPIFVYIPAWRGWTAMVIIIGFFLPLIPLMWNDYNNGNFPITGITGGIIGTIIVFACRDRVKMRKSGILFFPDDKHKSDEELASETSPPINIPWRKWNIFNRNS